MPEREPFGSRDGESTAMDRYRKQHRHEVLDFLQAHFSGSSWELTLPRSGRGHETYLARRDGERYFVKLGAEVQNYELLASIKVTPGVVQAGFLEDGTVIMVQRYVDGRTPSWRDFRLYLDQIASVVKRMHHFQALVDSLPDAPSPQYKDAGLAAVSRLQRRWERYRPHVPAAAGYVDESIAQLKEDVQTFSGGGLVASHNDICNSNWLVAIDGSIYLVDLEMMSQEDPAHDLGSLLWWYYPPELRRRFLDRAGYQDNAALRSRMRVRMALHCLDIILPRAQSFDRFNAGSFSEALRDFRAVVAGRENPHGYDD